MALNVNELDPDDPEFEAKVEAAQAEEDEARGQAYPTPEEEAEDEGSAPDTKAEAADGEDKPAEQPEKTTDTNTEPEKQSKPEGVLSKDGKTVLPFAVVQSARQRAKHAEEARQAAEARAAALEQQIADLKAGKPAPDDDDPLDAAVEEAAADVPVVKELHKLLKQTRDELAALKGGKEAPAQADKPAEPGPDDLQDAIDSVPLLATWQASDAEKFKRAVAIDNALKDSPKWRDRPLAERFAHVTKQVADEFDIEFEHAAPAPQKTTTSPNKADPEAVINRAGRTTPSTLSDFKNGAPDTQPNRLDKLSPALAVRRMEEMSDEEIDAHLAKFG